MTEQEVRQIIRDELSNILKLDRYVFDKYIQILNGRDIQLGVANGTRIGTATDQQIGFYGNNPIAQLGLITKPAAPSATYVQAEALAVRNAINSVIASLEDLGLISD